ncbi:Zinc finger MYND domain-containing protein 10 [Hondaea fermentalgiana]|uniref:Zinc finger MYND domain-containing protein 10 n=1 Tax=Hondaea fermentalgiana TaxID=2315210 RepID=A0A2R5GH15_9STRA|nr:Zinc finger MYND domain-containing protein 10 [Hondaea fermentalgiana]|eukprot:GBG30170.1 Zinc finger MYND domain-containing protein 10 [Hondaea fermentalgiana]
MVLPAHEAERTIEALKAFPVEEVGSATWMKQHLALQKLNLQAHESVQKNEENFVLEGLVTHDKLRVVVHELIVIEAWREHVLADESVQRHLAERNSIRGYHVAFHEATLCNLLEVVLYHDYAAQSCGETIVEVVDYCCRRLRWLCERSVRDEVNNGDDLDASGADQDQNAPELDTPEARLRDFRRQLRDVVWRCSIAAVSVLRFICEHVTQLPLSVMTRLLDTHDVPCLVVPCIENPPWTRRTSQGQWEKLRDHTWTKVEPKDLLLLTPLEAQPWLILFNLLCEGEVRKRYHFHSFRKDSLLRTRKYLNQTLVDQLPVLADLQRTFDELVIMDAPPATTSSALVLEQVAEVRDSLLRETNWNQQIQRVFQTTFKEKEGRDDPLVRQLAGLYNEDIVEELLSGRNTALDEGSSAQASSSGVTIEPVSEDEKNTNQDTARDLFPRQVTLSLQTGRKVRLQPIAESGTEQITAKGRFVRFQLHCPDIQGAVALDQENAAAKGNAAPDSQLGISLPFTDSFMLKMVVEPCRRRHDLENGETLESQNEITIYSKKPKASVATESEFWQKLGSLKDGAVAQVQCFVEDTCEKIAEDSSNSETAHATLRLGAVFISLAQDA